MEKKSLLPMINEEISDNDYDRYDAEQERMHRLRERLAREEEIADQRRDEEMYDKWEKEMW